MNGRPATDTEHPETADDFAALAIASVLASQNVARDAHHLPPDWEAMACLLGQGQVYATLAVAAATDAVWHLLNNSERMA